jgi:hypothetical protein
MIPRHKRNTNIGIGLGLLLSWSSSAMLRGAEQKPLRGAFVIAGLALFVWGCSQYALSKGYSAWWGALGGLSVFGMIVLVLLPDRRKTGMIRKQDEAYLFPSDERESGPR